MTRPTHSRGGVTYRVVVGTRVEDASGNRLDQDGARDGLQPKVWAFSTTSPGTILDCGQNAARADLRNAAEAANVCAADYDGSYAYCATVAQLRTYDFNPTVGVTVNGINGNEWDWSAATQFSGGGSAFTFATFGDDAGKVVEAPRGTGAPSLPDSIAEWDALAEIDTRNAATAATAYASDNNEYYTGITLAALKAYGFEQSPGVTTTVTAYAGGTEVAIVSEHAQGGRAYKYDSAAVAIVPVPR